MPKIRTKQWREDFTAREITYAERKNKSIEKVRIGKMRLAVYKDYNVKKYTTVETEFNDYALDFYYTFSDNIRNPNAPLGTYGGEGVTFRWLYAFLSAKRGRGTGFLDMYFSFYIYQRLGSEIKKLKEIFKIIKARRDLSGKFVSRQTQKNARDYLSYFENIVKNDCIDFVMEGNLGYVSYSTLQRRERAGISNEETYFATGQLINDIEITVIGG